MECVCDEMGRRITPAYAGKSLIAVGVFNLHWDHPRLRGEKLAIGYFLSSWLGSPPLTRGKVRDATVRRDRAGITPAYAGKSVLDDDRVNPRRDHPRLRGEK